MNPVATAVSPVNIHDPRLFALVTLLANCEFYSRKNGTNERMDGQVLANQVLQIAQITGMTELVSGVDASTDFLLLFDASAGAFRKVHPNVMPFVTLSSTTQYDSDAEAATGGVALNTFYIAGDTHAEGAVHGTLKLRTV